MANQSGVVGVLRALLTADTAQFDTSMRKSVQTTEKTTAALGGLGKEVQKLTPQAERMVKAFGGDRLMTQANNLVAAVQKIGGASKLTEGEQRRINATVTEAIAKYGALGQVAPQAMVNLQRATMSASGSVGGLVSGLGPLGPTVVGAFSATAVLGFARAIGETVDGLVRMRDQTGINFQGLQRLQIAADDTGNSLESITKSIGFLQRQLVESEGQSNDFTKALERLGLKANELRQLDPAAQFMQIGDALREIEDPALRADLAFKTMGKTGIEILPTLLRGFDDLRGRVVGMSDDAIRSIESLGDAWAAFSRTFKSEAANLGAGLLDVMFPFKDAVRTEEDLQKQLTDQTKARQSQIASMLPRLRDLSLSEEALASVEKSLTAAVQDSIKSNETRIASLARVKSAIDDLYQDVSTVATAIETAFDKALELDNIEDFRAQLRFIENELNQAQDISDSINKNIGTLDEERTRQLLAMNPPGSGIVKAAGGTIGETMGGEMKKKLGNAFEDVPHFFASSVLHTGSFINGLKALGVSMADAIAEPLLKQLGRRIASGIASWAAGRTVSTAATVAGGSTPWWKLIPGLLGSGNAPPPDPNKKGQPNNPPKPPSGDGIVPIPPTSPGGGGHVPTPPPISNLSIPRLNLDGFALPSVMQPAITAGGTFGDVMSPMAVSTSSMQPVVNNYVVNVEGMLDPGNLETLLRKHGYELIGKAFVLNEGFISTNAKKGLR